VNVNGRSLRRGCASIAAQFALLSLLWCTLLTVITPPFQAADEYLHFFRAYQISEGQLIPTRHQGECSGYSQDFADALCLGGWLPRSLLTTARSVAAQDLRFDAQKKQDFVSLRNSWQIQLHPTDRQFLKFNTTGLHAPIGYFPQAMGIAIGRLFALPPIGLMYLGRWVNSLVWVGAVTGAIALTPHRAIAWWVLGMLPMALFQAASLSADVVVNSAAVLLAAWILRLSCYRSPPAFFPAIPAILSGLAAILAWAKLAYLPLVAAVVVIPTRSLTDSNRTSLPPRSGNLFSRSSVLPSSSRLPGLLGLSRSLWGYLSRYLWRSPLWLITAFSSLLTSLLCVVLWSRTIKQIYVPLHAEIDPNAQIAWILANPGAFTGVMLRTISENSGAYWQQFVGVLGWLDTPLPKSFMGCYTIALLLSWVIVLRSPPVSPAQAQSRLITPASLTSFTRGDRLLILSAILGSLLALCGLAYLWNLVGAATIGGIQGRYLIPIVPFVLLLLENRAVILAWQSVRWWVWGISIASGLVTIATLLDRYYVS